jgi:hypothetical protein
MGRETAGATLSLEPGTGQIVLHRAERLDGLMARQLVDLVDAFADQAKHWLQRLSPEASGADAIGDEESPAGDFVQYRV